MLASSSSYKNLQCHLEVKMFLRGLHLVFMSLHKVADKVVRISDLCIRWKEECFNTLPVFIVGSSGERGWELRSFKLQYVLGSSSAQLNQNKKVPLARMRSLELVFSELRSNMIFLDFDISKVSSSIFIVFLGSPSSSVLITVLKLCVLTWSLNLSIFENCYLNWKSDDLFLTENWLVSDFVSDSEPFFWICIWNPSFLQKYWIWVWCKLKEILFW